MHSSMKLIAVQKWHILPVYDTFHRTLKFSMIGLVHPCLRYDVNYHCNSLMISYTSLIFRRGDALHHVLWKMGMACQFLLLFTELKIFMIGKSILCNENSWLHFPVFGITYTQENCIKLSYPNDNQSRLKSLWECLIKCISKHLFNLLI